MNNGKRALSVVVGLLASMIVLTLMELLNSKLFPIPQGINFKDPEAVKALIAAMPMGAKALQLVSYFVSAMVGGMVATKIVNATSKNPALIVGGILTFLGLINSVSLGEDFVMAALSFIMYIPGAFFGYRLMSKTK